MATTPKPMVREKGQRGSSKGPRAFGLQSESDTDWKGRLPASYNPASAT